MTETLAPKKTSVILSRVPPDEAATLAPRHEQIVAELTAAGIAIDAVDSVYDMYEHDEGVDFLRAVEGDLIMLAWHYPRATKWILARHNLEVNGATRKLHCVDARDGTVAALVQKLKDILAGTASAEVIPKPRKLKLSPTGEWGDAGETAKERGARAELELAPPENAKLSPRWYPVIDYDVCTNCMECMDFCLFGVYGVDHKETLRVTQQDQCRMDCPACSRVCPVGAIVFPKYHTNQTIAGAFGGGDRGEIKLDLSKIFGKPKARHQAAFERDQELIKAGRTPVNAAKVDKLSDAIDKLEL